MSLALRTLDCEFGFGSEKLETRREPRVVFGPSNNAASPVQGGTGGVANVVREVRPGQATGAIRTRASRRVSTRGSRLANSALALRGQRIGLRCGRARRRQRCIRHDCPSLLTQLQRESRVAVERVHT